MLKPLTLMARVLAIFTITIVQAQTSVSSNSMLCYISADQTQHKIGVDLSLAQPYTITCSYNDVQAEIPKYIQFACNNAVATLSVEINITNGTQEQKIQRDIPVVSGRKLYEIPVLAYVNDALIQEGKARISSIIFSNSINTTVHLTEVNFANTSNNYEVRLNQVFSVDKTNAVSKNYIIKSNAFKNVSINLYKNHGQSNQKILCSLSNGDNYMHFDELPLQDGKYVVVITESEVKPNKSSNAKAAFIN